MEIEFRKQLITPSIAKQLIEANISNRRVKTPIVERYAKDMAEGRWKADTGEAIKIAQNGVILDGQHRLYGLIKANVSLFFHVVTGLNEGVFDVLDTGSMRSACDVFYIKGVKNETTIPAMIQIWNQYKTFGNWLKGRQKDDRKTHSELLSMYYEREDFWTKTGSKSHTWYNKFAKIVTPSVLGGLYAVFYDISPTDAEKFMEQVCTGIGVENNGIYLLRNRLIEDKTSIKKFTTEYKHALIIKSWNFFRRSENIKVLKYNSSEEPHPKPI